MGCLIVIETELIEFSPMVISRVHDDFLHKHDVVLTSYTNDVFLLQKFESYIQMARIIEHKSLNNSD